MRFGTLFGVGQLLAGCCAFSAPRYGGPPSDHFDGARFVNQQPTDVAGPIEFLRWQRTRQPGKWERVEKADPGPPPPKRVEGGGLRVTWIGHASMLVQIDGLNLLADPVWSDRATPLSGIGPRRMHPPGLRFEDLPPIDVVVVSHNHYDHLDLPTLARLDEAHHPRFFVGLGNAALLEDAGIERVTELDWWERVELGGGLRLDMVPAQHFSMRGLCDRDATLWGGWYLEAPSGGVLFAGDTGLGPHFEQIRRRIGAPRLALLPIGAYLPRWIMSAMHMDPADAVEAHRRLGAATSVAMHFDTFALADEAQGQAPRDLRAATQKAGIADDAFLVPDFGRGIDVKP